VAPEAGRCAPVAHRVRGAQRQAHAGLQLDPLCLSAVGGGRLAGEPRPTSRDPRSGGSYADHGARATARVPPASCSGPTASGVVEPPAPTSMTSPWRRRKWSPFRKGCRHHGSLEECARIQLLMTPLRSLQLPGLKLRLASVGLCWLGRSHRRIAVLEIRRFARQVPVSPNLRAPWPGKLGRTPLIRVPVGLPLKRRES
jgi:hypothetical protein